ncbi:MAG TPA: serine/threonine-protein kinase [Planctomycetota bacterium]
MRGGREALAPEDDALPRIPGYEIESLLGRGGMGVVYRARHVSLDRTVAIKIPLAGALATATERQRHRREARAVAALKHPNIITVYDVGEFEGRPYFTMEFIEGQHLGAFLASTPQPAREAAALVATLADAVHRAHQAGIIHRDLKPANVLLAPDGTPKITDFGLSRHVGGDATLTVSGFQFGTPSYMAPEQASGPSGVQSSSVDTYALGSILYEMLTGRPPFRGESAVETVRQVLEEEPAPPSRLNPRVPRDLETICLTCLRKEAQRRYPSADALAQDLRRFLGGEPIQARPVGSLERLYRWGRRHPARATLVGGGACALVAALGVAFWMLHIQNARAGEVALREGRARQAIETAVSLANDLRRSGRWVEARHVLDDARAYVTEANSDDLARGLADADEYLTAAQELDEIRRRYPDCNEHGFDYRPAAEAYARSFTRLGLGEGVPLETAARAVDESPIREQILIALDNAAFVARAFNHLSGMDRPLAIARTADPDPWRDRFRQPAAWFDRDTLVALCDEAGSSPRPPPAHQIVIAGVLLSGLGASDKAIEILRHAHELDPVDFWVNLELGNALALAGRPADAAQYFRAAVTIQPQNSGPWASLGIQLDRIGSREEAIVAVRNATELNPRLVPAWRNHIAYLRSAGWFDEAEAAVSRAIEENPAQRDHFDQLRVSVCWDRARHSATSGEWLRALNEYRSVLPNGPDDAEFWFELAAVGLLVGERDAYQRTRDSMLEWARPTALRGFLVARAVTLTPAPAERVEAAVASSDAELRGSSTFWSLRQQGALLCRAGRHAEAVSLFEKSIASNPSAGRAVLSWLWLTIAYHHLGRGEDAARWHATAVAWLDAFGDGMPDSASVPGLHLHDWLEAQVLRQEADALLSAGKPGGGGASR